MRLRNVRGSREQIAQSEYVIKDPEASRGRWKERFADGKPIHIEIGMGKGRFLMELSRLHPEIHFIGIEKFSSVLVRALEKIEEDPRDNLHFLRMDAEHIEEVFGPGEVGRIYLNFSDPWPKERHVKRRLTSQQFLRRYEGILSPGGEVIFKTDNKDLFDFSEESVKLAGWQIEALTRDLHHSVYAEGNVMTEYEAKFVKRGNPICMMTVRPGDKTEDNDRNPEGKETEIKEDESFKEDNCVKGNERKTMNRKDKNGQKAAAVKPDRLCAIDLDGTLMRSDSVVSEYSKEVLRKAIEHGIEFLPTSGRSFRAAIDSVKDIEGTRYLLGGNASVITEIGTEKIMKQWIIPQKISYEIYHMVKDNGGYIEMYCENDVYTERGTEEIAYRSKLNPTFVDSLLETVIRVPSMEHMLKTGIMQVNKIHIVFPDQEDLYHYAEEIRAYPEVNVVHPTHYNMEVFPSDCNKDIGMEYVRNMLDIPWEGTIAIGDSGNDRAMIEYAATGLAVANSMDVLKEAADRILLSNDEDGPARYLEELIEADN